MTKIKKKEEFVTTKSINNNNNRNVVNILNILLTIIILLITINMSDGSFATHINKISENLDKALTDIMIQGQPNYTNLTINATYISKNDFNPRGMSGLYNFTNLFLDLILSKDIYPEGFLKFENNEIHFGDFNEQWQGLLSKYIGLLLMLIIIVLLIIFMPFCGLCFCCCRCCCGKCGARSQPFDKKHDLCKKIILATFLIGLGTLLLFGVVCAFASNQHMEEGINELTKNLRNSIKDTNTYLDTTNKQVNILLNTNYNEFEQVLVTTMEESNNIVYDELQNYSNATSMLELADVVEKLPKIRQDFDTLKYSTNSLRVYASQLNDAVRKVKKDLLATLAKCQQPKCTDINKNISSLQTNIHFNSLPDISEQIETLEDLPLDDFKSAVTKGIENLEKVKEKIGETVNTTLTKALDQINKAGIEIKKRSTDITEIVNKLENEIDDYSLPALNTADEYIKKYSYYRYYASLAISCILLLIALCIALGLICGICGKRPDVYGDDCCNKGAGSQFLICGVMLMFLAGLIIAIVILIMFTIGIITQRIICDPIRNPENSQVFNLIDEGIHFNENEFNITISKLLINCYKNDSLYNVLNLNNKINLNDIKNYLEKFNITNILDSLDMGSIGFDSNFHILEENDRLILVQLANSDFANIKFDNFKSLLEESFTTVNLTDLSNELGNLINQIENDGNDIYNILTDLKLSKLHLEMYQEKIVEPMIKNATDVVNLAKGLDGDLKLGHDSFQDAITYLLNELKLAEDTLKFNGTENLKKIARDFTNGIVNQVQNYLDRVVDNVNDEIGECGPLSATINATVTSTCDKILLPWNGFWFGLFWSILLFIPTIIISIKLATLYQKYSPYSGALVEAEYLYDAYADNRDNIPLNSRHSKKNKKKNKKYKNYEDRPVTSNGGGGVGGISESTDIGSRDYASGSHNQDTRYVDMAPKQWSEEFPTNSEGPPQYQRAPTEYERPPPYYYPGAGGGDQ